MKTFLLERASESGRMGKGNAVPININRCDGHATLCPSYPLNEHGRSAADIMQQIKAERDSWDET